MTTVYREYSDSDFAELSQMVMALYGEDNYGQPMSLDNISSTVDELTKRPELGGIYIFTVDDIICGYSIVVNFWSNEYGGKLLIIDEMFVKSEFRCKQIGAGFFDFLDTVYGGTVKGMFLEVAEKNERAIKFYLKSGFAPAKNRHLFKQLS